MRVNKNGFSTSKDCKIDATFTVWLFNNIFFNYGMLSGQPLSAFKKNADDRRKIFPLNQFPIFSFPRSALLLRAEPEEYVATSSIPLTTKGIRNSSFILIIHF